MSSTPIIGNRTYFSFCGRSWLLLLFLGSFSLQALVLLSCIEVVLSTNHRLSHILFNSPFMNYSIVDNLSTVGFVMTYVLVDVDPQIVLIQSSTFNFAIASPGTRYPSITTCSCITCANAWAGFWIVISCGVLAQFHTT